MSTTFLALILSLLLVAFASVNAKESNDSLDQIFKDLSNEFDVLIHELGVLSKDGEQTEEDQLSPRFQKAELAPFLPAYNRRFALDDDLSGACPRNIPCPSGIRCGCEIVGGLGSTKKQFLQAGANVQFLASAMMETRDMKANYAFGDHKSYDSFNAGVLKMNWFMMRNCHPAWKKLGPGDYKTAAKLNSNKSLDVKVYKECKAKYGKAWIKGHRGGESGLRSPMTRDLKLFQRGYDWTVKMLNKHPEAKSNDVRFWVDIYAI